MHVSPPGLGLGTHLSSVRDSEGSGGFRDDIIKYFIYLYIYKDIFG
jgi:hypothetical protein